MQLNSSFIYIKWTITIIENKHILYSGKDITEEENQRLELEKLSLIALNVINGTAILDKNHCIEWANDSLLNLMEYSLKEIIGKRPIDIFSAGKLNEDLISEIKEKNEYSIFELKQLTKSGKCLELLIHQNVIYNSNNEIINFVMVVTDITKSKAKEEINRFLVDNTKDVLFTTDAFGKFNFISSNCKKLIGFNPEELINKPFYYIIHPRFKDKAEKFYKKQIDEKELITTFEFLIIDKSGDEFWIEQTMKLSLINDEFEGFHGMMKDVTEVKSQLSKIQERSERKEIFNKFLFEQSATSIAQFSNFKQYVEVILKKLYGVIEIDRISLWIFENDIVRCVYANFPNDSDDFFNVNDYPIYYEAIERGKMLNFPKARMNSLTRGFNEIYFIPNNIFSIVDVPLRLDADVFGVLSIEDTYEEYKRDELEIDFIQNFSDLIAKNKLNFDRIEAEKRTQESELNFRLLNEAIDDVFWLIDLNSSKLIYLSPSVKSIFGKNEDVFFESTEVWNNILVKDEASIAFLNTRNDYLNNSIESLEYRIIVENEIRTIKENYYLIYDEENKPFKLSIVSSDISQQKIAENEIKQLSLVAEKATNGITISDENGCILFANNSYLKMFEISMSEVLGKRPSELFNPDSVELNHKLIDLTKNNQPFELEINAKTFNGNEIWVELHNTPVINELGVKIQLEILNDITERKRSEQLIAVQTEEIYASIRYAQKIQQALLTADNLLKSFDFNLHYFYKPKNIVGGDFYWATKIGSHVIFAVGDCTGHGVPGAMLTSVAINALNSVVHNKILTSPDLILELVDEYFKNLLKNEIGNSDGMDIAVLSIDCINFSVEFAGANRYLFIKENNSVEKINGTSKSIGSKYSLEKFKKHSFDWKETQEIYLFSDGITDQFGEENGKKWMQRNLKELIEKLSQDTVNENVNEIHDELIKHKGNLEQTDDIVLFGLKRKK